MLARPGGVQAGARRIKLAVTLVLNTLAAALQFPMGDKLVNECVENRMLFTSVIFDPAG